MRRCGAMFEAPDGIPRLRLPGNLRTDTVRRFYEGAPFPGYPPHDSLHALHMRAERSEFARLLDEAIPGDARVVDVGCGTGQMCLYLARADRVVIGADLSRPSLQLGAAAAARFKLDRVLFVETDLQQPALAKRRVRRGLFFRRRASHTRPARRLRPACAAGPAWGNDCARRLQRIRPHSSAVAAHSGPALKLPLHSVSIRCCAKGAMNRNGGKPGCAISISTRRSIVIRSRKYSGGLRKTTPITSALIRLQCWATNPGNYSLPRPTTGAPKAGSLNWTGCGCSDTKADSSSRWAGVDESRKCRRQTGDAVACRHRSIGGDRRRTGDRGSGRKPAMARPAFSAVLLFCPEASTCKSSWSFAWESQLVGVSLAWLASSIARLLTAKTVRLASPWSSRQYWRWRPVSSCCVTRASVLPHGSRLKTNLGARS